jgi:Fasciclin domain
MQAHGSKFFRRLLSNLQSTAPVPADEAFTYCAPVPQSFDAINASALTDAQLEEVLRTHLGIGQLYSDGVYTGLTVPTEASNQRLTFRKTSAGAGVRALGSEVPYSNVIAVDVRTCAGPVHVIDRFLTPAGLEGVISGNATKNSTCTPAVPAMKKAGGDAIVSAIELAVVCAHCTLCFLPLAIHRELNEALAFC